MVDRRQAVLDTLRSAGVPMSIIEVARHLQVHPNTARFHLRVLAREGRVEQVEHAPAAPGRPPLLFRAIRGMDPNGPRNYRALADALATRMSAEADVVGEAMLTGREWGARLADEQGDPAKTDGASAVDQLMVILDELGFAPERREENSRPQIELHHCPFLDLIPDHENVICPVHLGLMQGAMKAMDATATVDRLEPFAEPDLCLAHLSAGSVAS